MKALEQKDKEKITMIYSKDQPQNNVTNHFLSNQDQTHTMLEYLISVQLY